MMKNPNDVKKNGHMPPAEPLPPLPQPEVPPAPAQDTEEDLDPYKDWWDIGGEG